MTWARDIAEKYHANGYKPIPADARVKVPRVAGFYNQYDFGQLWKNWLDCDVALVLDGLVCVDFDRHEASPNSGDYYDALIQSNPKVFRECPIEQSKSGGIHAYYRWTVDLPRQQWLFPVTMDGKKINVEIKTGRRLAFCYPSKGYIQIQGSLEDTRLDGLPPLPTMFRYYKAPQPRTMAGPIIRKDMTPGQREKAVEVIVDIYGRNAGRDGAMHNGALGLAGYMAGLGYDRGDIERALRAYEHHGHRPFRRGELEELCDYGLDNPDRDAIPPWKRLKV